MNNQLNGLSVGQLVQGFVALCLGSSDRLVWVDQSDAKAFTHGGNVYLPRPQGVDGEKELLIAIALREIAKITHSDEVCFQSAQQDIYGYAASVEEARIKQAISADYKGAASIFDAATAVVHQEAMRSINGPSPDVEQLKQLAIWFAANDALLGTPSATQAAIDAISVAANYVEEPVLQKAVGLAQASPFLGSSKASVMCASRIHALLKVAVEEHPQQSPDGQGECNDGGAGGQTAEGSTPAGQGEADGTPDQRSESDSGGAESQQGGSDGRTAQNGGAQQFCQDPMSNALAKLKGHGGAKEVVEVPTPTSDNAALDTRALQAAQELLADENSAQKLKDIQASAAAPAASGQDATEALTAESSAQDSDSDDPTLYLAASSERATVTYTPGANALDAMPARLVNVLLREFNEKRQAKIQRRDFGNDVAVASLWRLKRLGDTMVFHKKSPASGVDAAVMLLLDVSHSMRGSVDTAVSATCAIAQALQRISGIQTAISLFPSKPEPTLNVLNFRQNLAQAKAKLRGVIAQGGTPTAEAVASVVPLLVRAQVQKRVLLIITDGKPDDLDRAKGEIASAKRAGVDVIGIGIGSRAQIESLLPNRSVSISDVAQLPQAFEQLFKSKLSASLLAA